MVPPHLLTTRIAGIGTQICIDDHFPCYTKDDAGGPIFSRANGAELWVMLIEKAYAKLHGCELARATRPALLSGARYGARRPAPAPCRGTTPASPLTPEGGNTNNRGARVTDRGACPNVLPTMRSSYYHCRFGSPDEALIDLTGAPTIKIDLSADRARVDFDELLAWDRNGCLIAASTPGVDAHTEGGSREGRGLVPGHAYTVVQARVIQRGRYKGANVLQMRNPWGEFEWGGAWSDNSPEMLACRAELEEDFIETNESKRASDKDGIFWSTPPPLGCRRCTPRAALSARQCPPSARRT